MLKVGSFSLYNLLIPSLTYITIIALSSVKVSFSTKEGWSFSLSPGIKFDEISKHFRTSWREGQKISIFVDNVSLEENKTFASFSEQMNKRLLKIYERRRSIQKKSSRRFRLKKKKENANVQNVSDFRAAFLHCLCLTFAFQ